jgi:integrase
MNATPARNRYAVAVSRRAEIVGLNFHDLRREASSRLLESGMPEHHVQRFLDHANLSTTSRDLKITRRGMHEALEARRGAPKPLHNKPILLYR